MKQKNTKIAVTDRQKKIYLKVGNLSVMKIPDIFPSSFYGDSVWEAFNLGREYEKEAKS